MTYVKHFDNGEYLQVLPQLLDIQQNNEPSCADMTKKRYCHVIYLKETTKTTLKKQKAKCTY